MPSLEILLLEKLKKYETSIIAGIDVDKNLRKWKTTFFNLRQYYSSYEQFLPGHHELLIFMSKKAKSDRYYLTQYVRLIIYLMTKFDKYNNLYQTSILCKNYVDDITQQLSQ